MVRGVEPTGRDYTSVQSLESFTTEGQQTANTRGPQTRTMGQSQGSFETKDQPINEPQSSGCWFESDDAAHGRGQANASADVRPEPERRPPGRYEGRLAPTRAVGSAVLSQWVSRDAVDGVAALRA